LEDQGKILYFRNNNGRLINKKTNSNEENFDLDTCRDVSVASNYGMWII
jgi:hypothetical protein